VRRHAVGRLGVAAAARAAAVTGVLWFAAP